MRFNPCVFVAFTLSLVANVGCSNSDFGGTNGTASSKKDDAGDAGDAGDADDDDEKDTGKGDSDSDSGTDSDSAADGEDGTESDAKAGALVNEEEAACLLKKGDNFRIMFALDNSGSTQFSDPANVRRDAALRLVEKFTDFVKANPKVKFSVSALAYASTTQVGSHRWMKLTVASQSDIDADITAATTNPGSGTNFTQAFEAADPLFVEDGATASEKRQRSYMILLSDGKANGPSDQKDTLVSKLMQMANDRGVAVYSILIGGAGVPGGLGGFGGFGGGTPNDADPHVLMPAMAVPTTGVVGPDHVGTFVEAPDPTAIDKAFEGFFKKVTGC